MKLQAIDDLVDHLALGAKGEPDQIEFGAKDPLHGRAVGFVMRGPEHVFGIDGGRHIAGERALQGTRERCAVRAVDQDWLADQRQIFRARAILVSFADASGKGGGNSPRTGTRRR